MTTNLVVPTEAEPLGLPRGKLRETQGTFFNEQTAYRRRKVPRLRFATLGTTENSSYAIALPPRQGQALSSSHFSAEAPARDWISPSSLASAAAGP